MGLFMLMSYVKKNRVRDYWSLNPLISTPMFSKLTSQNRFAEIFCHLHFVNNQTLPADDKIGKIRPVVDYIRNEFRQTLQPFRDLCIDESLVAFKGRLSWKQYIPSKRTRFGMKCFVLTDVECKMIIDFIVYSGK